MHAGRRLFGDAAPFLHDFVPEERVLRVDLLEQVLDDFLFVAARFGVDPIAAFFELVAFVDEERHVAAVIDDELRAFAAGERERLSVHHQYSSSDLAFPGEDRHAGLRDRGGGVVLRRENVAASPAHVGAELDQRLDEHRGLDRHVQRAGDADALERLGGGVLFADRHQAGHLLLGDVDFVAAPIGEADVGDFVVVGLLCGSSGRVCSYSCWC